MVIKLYDIDNKKYLFDVKKPIDRGHTGLVYKIDDDTCLKYTTSYRLHQWYTLSKLMELNLDNFYKIYKILFDSNGDYSGYLMKYYQNELIDILTMPTEYTLDNFYRLSNTVNKISNNEIVMYDLHDGNVIMNKNDIIIIDADFYDEEYTSNIEKIKIDNYELLLYLFKDLYKINLEEHFTNYTEEYRVILDLFSKNENIYQKLKDYKYPIDYIKSKTKKKQ